MVRRRLRRAHTGNQMRRFSALWCFQTRTSSALSEGTGSTNCEANIHAVSQKMSRVVNNHNGAGNAWCTELTVCRSVSVPPREWQMERAFQTALALLRPEVVFILGDVFDEGKWSSPKNWEEDVCRFQKMFRHPSDTELVVLVGNHDIGFHYEMDWFKLQRFEKAFNTTSTRMVTKKGVNFLLVNSVALHGDGCPICQSVEKQLYTLSRNLNCSLLQNSQSSIIKEFCRDAWTYPPTPPIILQHYPLYRVSDAGCTGRDAAPPEERHLLFREKYDVLSQEASHRLLQWFKPRLVLSGHTHSGCQVLHDNRYTEISVPSFNWRNRNNPSFILGSFSPSGYGLSKCFLPEESTVIALYCSTGASLLLLPLVHCLWIRGLLRCLNFCPISKHKSL